MTTTTSTVFVTSTNDPYTLAAGSEITITTPTGPNPVLPGIPPPVTETDSNVPGAPYFEAGEAIYTVLNGASITNHGTIIDSAAQQITDEYGVQSKAATTATLDNFGLISAPNMTYAVGFNDGTIINEIGSTITGIGGIKFGSGTNPGTIINAGTIIGTGGTGILFDNAPGDELILDPGQVLEGGATATGAGAILALGSGATMATLAHPGNYHGFTTLSVAAGADWQIGGSVSGISTIDSFGTVNLQHAISGTTIDLEGNGAHSEAVFNGAASGANLFDSVTNFGATDSIVVTGYDWTGQNIVYDYANGTLSVSPAGGGGFSEQFAVAGPNGNLTPSSGIVGSGQESGQFKFTILADGDLLVSDQPCFAAGTRILTPNGEKLVEQLIPGDEVLTAREGHEGVAEIIWVGQRTIDLARHAMPEKARPIRILAGAFGPGLPERDLRLSPDHALYIDGHLIEAKTLVNGVTVIAEQKTRYVTYHHIELAQHDVVLAEGLPAETYLESGNRQNFESDAVPLTLHPDFVATARAKACATLLVDGPAVISIRQKLLDRALALGFTPTGDADLVVKAGAERIRPKTDMEGELLFVLPAGLKAVELLSSAGVPAELSADPSDRRVLGVNVENLAIIANGKRHPIALDDAGHIGFHDMEAGRRWTNGAARIQLPAYSGRAVLEVAIAGQAKRWSSAGARLSAL